MKAKVSATAGVALQKKEGFKIPQTTSMVKSTFRPTHVGIIYEETSLMCSDDDET